MSSYYKIRRDKHQTQSRPIIEKAENEIICTEENGCQKVLTNQRNLKTCHAQCSATNNCIGCEYNPGKEKCICYQDNSNDILDREFNLLTDNVHRSQRHNSQNRSSLGFGKKGFLIIILLMKLGLVPVENKFSKNFLFFKFQ